MLCPVCDSGKSKVTNVRRQNATTGEPRNIIYRRRRCLECGYDYSTYEVEICRLTEMFEEHITNPEILGAVTSILAKEFPGIKRYRKEEK